MHYKYKYITSTCTLSKWVLKSTDIYGVVIIYGGGQWKRGAIKFVCEQLGRGHNCSAHLQRVGRQNFNINQKCSSQLPQNWDKISVHMIFGFPLPSPAVNIDRSLIWGALFFQVTLIITHLNQVHLWDVVKDGVTSKWMVKCDPASGHIWQQTLLITQIHND